MKIQTEVGTFENVQRIAHLQLKKLREVDPDYGQDYHIYIYNYIVCVRVGKT